MKKFILLFLFIITLIAGILRFYKLGVIPLGFHRDEAFLGYNAYSILKTGRDMTGHLLPLHFESFLWSPALYSYFSIPPIAFFGLTPFSTRFASAFFGTLTIPMLFIFVRQLFQSSITNNPIPNNTKYSMLNKKTKKQILDFGHLKFSIVWLLDIRYWSLSEKIALLSAFFLSISPWHINLSRTATENTLAVFFILLGTYLLVRWLQNPVPKLLCAGYLSFLITLYLYQAPRAYLPLFLPLFAVLFWKKFSVNMKIQYCIVFCLCILLPLLLIFSSKTLSTRAATVGLFASEETQLVIDESLREGGVQKVPPAIERIFHNKVLGYGNAFFKNYMAHVSYPFLFTDNGLPDRYRVPDNGLLYVYELPLLLIGIFTLIQSKSMFSWMLFLMLVLTPIGSAYAFDDVPNLQRTLLAAPLVSIISTFGFHAVFRNTKFKLLFLELSAMITVLSVSFYLHQYYIHMPIHRPWFRHEGYKELISKILSIQSNYQKVIITNRESAPAIFFLFFQAYDPKLYQAETTNPNHRSFDRLSFNIFEFTLEECPVRVETNINQDTKIIETIETGEPGNLYVNGALCEKLPKKARVIETIQRGDNTKIFDVIDVP